MNTPGHETGDARPWIVGLAFAILGGTLLLTLACVAALWAGFEHGDPMRTPAPRTPPPAPRLEVVGGADLAAVDRLAAQRLEGWGWSDKAGGLAHVPIERAMQLRAQAGWADQGTPSPKRAQP